MDIRSYLQFRRDQIYASRRPHFFTILFNGRAVGVGDGGSARVGGARGDRRDASGRPPA